MIADEGLEIPGLKVVMQIPGLKVVMQIPGLKVVMQIPGFNVVMQIPALLLWAPKAVQRAMLKSLLIPCFL